MGVGAGDSGLRPVGRGCNDGWSAGTNVAGGNDVAVITVVGDGLRDLRRSCCFPCTGEREPCGTAVGGKATAVDVRGLFGATVVCVGSCLSINRLLRRFVGKVGRAVSVRWGSRGTD